MGCGYRNALTETCLALLLCTLNWKKHNVDQLRRWLSGRAIKSSGKDKHNVRAPGTVTVIVSGDVKLL